MDTSTSNNNIMFQEAAEGGGSSTATLETPSLREIVNQEPEKALKDMESFKQQQIDNLNSLFNLIGEKGEALNTDFEARTVIEMKYQEHEKLMNEIYQSAIHSARRDDLDLFYGVVNIQESLLTEYEKGLQATGQSLSNIRAIENPYNDPLFKNSLSIEIEKMSLPADKWEGIIKELEEQTFTTQKEEEIKVEKREVPELTKAQLKEISTLYKKMEEDPEFKRQIEEANPQVIQAPPEEVKAMAEKAEKESTLWKYAKKGILYLAIGGAIAAGVVFLGPTILAWAEKAITSIFGSEALTTLSSWVNGAFEVIKEGVTWIGDKVGEAWNWVSGIFSNTEAGRGALEAGKEALQGGGGIVPNFPDLPIVPIP